MNHDRELIDTIKENFARKSSAQLIEILNSNDHDRWSPEAFVAAREILSDRDLGKSQDPLMGEAELPPPPHYDLGLVALGALGGLATSFLVIPGPTIEGAPPDPYRAFPFGPNIAWLALDTTDTQAVAAALRLQNVSAAACGAGG